MEIKSQILSMNVQISQDRQTMEVVQLLQSNAKEKTVLSCYLTAINVHVNMQTLAILCTKTTKLEQNSETYQPTVTITSQTLLHFQTLSPHNSLML